MRYRDFIQNITITFLALLSLFLFSRTQFFQLGAAAGSGTWQRLTAPVFHWQCAGGDKWRHSKICW